MLNFLTTTTVCGFSLYHVLAFFLIYSCTGWCLEVIFAAATTGQLVNRGFLNGPVCPIYGFGMVIVLFTLTPLQDSVLLLYIGGVSLKAPMMRTAWSMKQNRKTGPYRRKSLWKPRKSRAPQRMP